MIFKALCALAVTALLCACDPGSGDLPDLSLEAYLTGRYSGTFSGGGTDTETVTFLNPTYPFSGDEYISFDADVTITIVSGTWECAVDGDGTLTGPVAGNVNVTYSTDTGYDGFLPDNSSTPISGDIEASLFDGILSMSCPGIDIYDYGERELAFTGTVTDGDVDGTWTLSNTGIGGTFEGTRGE